MNRYLLILGTIALSVLLGGCDSKKPETTSELPEQKIVTIKFLYEQSLKDYARPLVEDFLRSAPKLGDGSLIQVDLFSSSSMEGMKAIARGSVKGDLWLASSEVLINWSNKNLENLGAKHEKCKRLFSTPYVLAGKKELVDALGEKDIFPLARSIQNGELSLSHVAPRSSSQSIFSLAQALRALEPGMKWTADEYREREQFIHGYEMSEQLLLQGLSSSENKLTLGTVTEQAMTAFHTSMNEEDLIGTVPIPYGTYELNYNLCFSQGDWVTPARSVAAKIFSDWLSSKDAQQKIQSLGFRPALHGLAPKTEKSDKSLTLTPETLDLIHTKWDSSRRKSTLVVVVDRSGSVDPNHLSSTQRGLRYLFAKRGKGEPTSLITISSTPQKTADFSTDAESLVKTIDKLYPLGGSALYDGIRLGYDEFQSPSFKKLEKNNNRKILLVITDGQDTNSQLSLSAIEQMAKTRTDLFGVKLVVLGLPSEQEHKETLQKITKLAGGTYIETEGFEIDKHIDELVF